MREKMGILPVDAVVRVCSCGGDVLRSCKQEGK